MRSQKEKYTDEWFNAVPRGYEWSRVRLLSIWVPVVFGTIATIILLVLLVFYGVTWAIPTLAIFSGGGMVPVVMGTVISLLVIKERDR
jgi:hypothetical protein